MKNLLFLILAVLTLNLRLSTLNCFAQTLERQVISSSGGEYSNINLNLNFTVGEAVTETFGNTSLILTQGFQQPKQDTLFITLDSLNNITCFNGNNGAIYISVTSGTPPYNYSWSNGSTTEDVNGLIANIYFVTVTDAFGNSADTSFTLTQPSALLLSVTSTNTSCGAESGTAQILVTGGVLPYNYLWTSGDTVPSVTALVAGIYMVTVTDANNCSSFAMATISSSNGPAVSGFVITDVSCYGGNNGIINITVTGGTSPYTYEWSNGATTQNISGLLMGPYEVIITDADSCESVQSFMVNQPAPMTLSYTATDAGCSMNNGSVTVSAAGGMPPYAVLWSTGGTGWTENGLAAGTYSCTVTDSQSCTAFLLTGITISNSGGPVVTIDSVTNTVCGGTDGAVYISVTGGTAPYTFLWSNTSANEDLTGISNGLYNVSVTDASGCIGAASAQVQGITPLEQPICIVTVDSTIERNLVVWEKVQTTGIAFYRIYRETSQVGIFQTIATQPYDSLSVYTDPNANPFVHAWKYKISAVDNCGNESPPSQPHKTIHLTVNQGTGSSYNLIWDNYEGFPYYTFYVNRHTNALGWVILDSLPNTSHSFTDIPPTNDTIAYLIEAVNPAGCISSKAVSHNSTRSNVQKNFSILDNIPLRTDNDLNLKIYPNPTNTKVYIESANDLKDAVITVYNIHSQILLQQSLQKKTNELNISGFNSGMYFVKIQTKESVGVWKVVKE